MSDESCNVILLDRGVLTKVSTKDVPRGTALNRIPEAVKIVRQLFGVQCRLDCHHAASNVDADRRRNDRATRVEITLPTVAPHSATAIAPPTSLINAVMEARRDLVDVVHALRQVVCCKE